MSVYLEPDDAGCLADGGFGHAHVREVLAMHMRQLSATRHVTPDDQTRADALDLLNHYMPEGYRVGFCDGDLLMLSDDDWAEHEGC